MKKPIVTILHHTPVSLGEIAARVCYDSFDKGNEPIQTFGENMLTLEEEHISKANESTNTSLVERLVWVNHHESIMEHISVTFLIQNISRGVLHHQARHRIQGLSVQSTRYTMVKLGICLAILKFLNIYDNFKNTISIISDLMVKENILVCEDKLSIRAEASYFVRKTSQYVSSCGLIELVSKEQLDYIESNITVNTVDILSEIDNISKLKSRKNVGDNLKNGVTDEWNTKLVSTMNLRALKNYLKLRNSGASYAPTRILAEQIEKSLPKEILNLVVKPKHKD